MAKKILLMYISLNSGHHRASLGLEQAIRQLSPDTLLSSVNALHYAHPILEGVIKRSYIGLLRYCPQLWNYLYDRPGIVKGTQPFTNLLYRFDVTKLKPLLEEFRPAVVACTQAVPCGMVAEYKRKSETKFPLVAILTDYYAHSYWLSDQVDYYVVPSEQARQRLLDEGILAERILPFGIPVDPRFGLPGNRQEILQRLDLDMGRPTLLVMGGSYGFGPIAELVERIGRSSAPVQLLVVCGKNEKLRKRLSRQSFSFGKTVRVFGYIDTIHELMEIATCLISKPGGVTTAEALAKGLPMILLNPIGGQETANAEFLLKEGLALKAETPAEVLPLVQGLLSRPAHLDQMRRRCEKHRRPASALELARMLLSIS